MPGPKEKTFTITLNLRQTLCLLSSLVEGLHSLPHNHTFAETTNELVVELGKQIFVNWPTFAKQAVQNFPEPDATAQEDHE